MKSYPQIAARLFGTPLLLVPDKAEMIASVLSEQLGVAPMLDIQAGEDGPRIRAALDGAGRGEDKPYAVVDGVAVIAVVGELVNRGSWLDAYSGLTSYESIASDLQTALDDAAVTGIVLDIDSPGGEAAGAMETAALIRKASSSGEHRYSPGQWRHYLAFCTRVIGGTRRERVAMAWDDFLADLDEAIYLQRMLRS